MNRFMKIPAFVAGTLLWCAFPVLAQETRHCTLPGELVAEDATGDATFITASDPTPGHDVLDVFIAEPPSADGVDRIYFTLTVDRLEQAATPLSSYQVEFTTDDGVNRFVLYVPYPAPEGAAVFSGQDLMYAYGHNEVGPGGTSTFVIDGPAGAESQATPDGQITLVLTREQLALEAGATLNNVAGISQVNFGGAGTIDVDSSNSRGFYQVRGSASCSETKSGILGVGGLSTGLLVLLGLAGLVRRRIA